MTISQEQINAMDECAEYAAHAHPLPHPQPARVRLVPSVAKPEPVLIEHDEPPKTEPSQMWLMPVVFLVAWTLIFFTRGFFSGHLPDLTSLPALFGHPN